MSDLNRIILAPVEFVPIRSLRFALRCALCFVLTGFNAGVIAYFAPTLYHATTGQPLQVGGVTVLFAALLSSLVRVWKVALGTRFR